MCGARWHHRLPLPTPAKREQLHVNRPDPALKTAPVEEGEPDLHTGPALGATARQVGLLQRARPRLRAFGHRALGSVWPPSPKERPLSQEQDFLSSGALPSSPRVQLLHVHLAPTPSRPRCSEPPHSRAGWGGR